MRVLFALPGLHKYARGAEVAFISVARQLVRSGNMVTLIGSGPKQNDAPYRFLHADSAARESFESFPTFPVFRNECSYEEFTFLPGLFRKFRPEDYDVTVTCSYPFTNWALRRPTWRTPRPRHVFVTQNGDWPASSNDSEFRFFGCDGLVCTNPDFFERNREKWRCQLIPNGVDIDLFKPGPGQREKFSLPSDRLIVLMVSALIPTKRVEAGVEAVSLIPGAHLVVAGDGPQRHEVEKLAARLLPGRFTRLSLTSEAMPSLYRSADVFLHLSIEEAFGNVFIEAMACGLPVVAHDSTRLRWIVGEDEFLVDTRDTAAVARQIDLARNAPMDKRQTRAGRAERFSWERVGGMYRDFLEEIVDSA